MAELSTMSLKTPKEDKEVAASARRPGRDHRRSAVAPTRERFQKLSQRAQRTLAARVLAAYGESQAGSYALALAFAGFMSMFPIILGALAVIGFAIHDPTTEAKFQAFLINVFPASAHDELQKALEGVKQSTGWLAVVSLAGLLWSASSIFATMEFAMTQIYGTRQRNMLKQRLMGLAMMVFLIAAVVVTVLANALAGFVPLVGTGLGFLVGSAVMVSLLVALYGFVPNRPFRVRDVLPGALLAGVFIEILSLAFGIYARIEGGFNTYGAQFALFFLLAAWFYLLSQFVLLGAVYNKFRLEESEAKPLDAPVPEARPALPPRRSVFQRVALGGVVAAAVVAGLVRRWRRSRATG